MLNIELTVTVIRLVSQMVCSIAKRLKEKTKNYKDRVSSPIRKQKTVMPSDWVGFSVQKNIESML